jgi:hypothetical protein
MLAYAHSTLEHKRRFGRVVAGMRTGAKACGWCYNAPRLTHHMETEAFVDALSTRSSSLESAARANYKTHFARK